MKKKNAAKDMTSISIYFRNYLLTIPISTFTFVSKISVIFGRAYHGNKYAFVNQPLPKIFTSDDPRQNLLANNFQIATFNSN